MLPARPRDHTQAAGAINRANERCPKVRSMTPAAIARTTAAIRA